MQGIEATFGDVWFERGRSPDRALNKIIPAAAALALAGSVGVALLHTRTSVAPDAVNPPSARLAPAPTAGPAAEAAAKPYGEIVIDPSFLAEMKQGAPAGSASQLASLDSVPAPFPLPSLDAFPPEPSAVAPAETAPLPPTQGVPEIGESAPLPPPRPPEFGAPSAPERHLAPPSVAAVRPAAPGDNRNIFQKLFGLGLPPSPAVASAPAAPAPATVSRLASASGPAAAGAAEARSVGRGPFFALPPPFGASAPAASTDRYTAVYDISARTVYMPDGTKLEAHSGLGDALDNPRYVSERMRGPTPPHVYELQPREASFHGVQALRLIPIGDGDLFGRAGLLAHPFMLGPNGDSNGCVSVKDYEAFLRAYESGEIKRLVVVANL
jgi:Protein of unknown function (DUF2778)